MRCVAVSFGEAGGYMATGGLIYRDRRFRLQASMLFAASFALASVSGCEDAPVANRPDLNSMKAVGILYGKYVGAHNGQPPKNEKDFVQYVSTRERDLLKQFAIEDPAKLVISPRNGQPLVIVSKGPAATDLSRIVAYESQPVDGTRLVVRDTGSVQELAEEEFQKQKPDS